MADNKPQSYPDHMTRAGTPDGIVIEPKGTPLSAAKKAEIEEIERMKEQMRREGRL